VQGEEEGRQPVGQPDGDDAEGAAGDDREPDDGHELERVPDLADRIREIGAAEIRARLQHIAIEP
jgi:hypothetical protein